MQPMVTSILDQWEPTVNSSLDSCGVSTTMNTVWMSQLLQAVLMLTLTEHRTALIVQVAEHALTTVV